MSKRRLNSEGSITHRADGRWMARISHEGRRVAVYGKTKEEARQKLRALQRKQDDGQPLVTSRMLLRDYLPQWLESIKYRIRPKTVVDYGDLVKHHLIPRLGHIQLNKLDREHIQKAWADMLKEGHSPGLVEHCHLRLSKALNDAMDRKDSQGQALISRNPCQRLPHPRADRKEINPPDADAINRMLAAAQGTEYYEAIHTSFYTGLRRGELLALRWRDVDLSLATLSVNRSLYRAKGGQSIIQDPKTAKARRLVSLTPSSALLLKSLWERQVSDGLLIGYTVNGDSPAFRYRNGSPILPRGYSGAFTKIMRRAGLEGYRLHDARHAHATLMLRQGIHPKIVQERLGHAKVGTTLDIYSHVTPGLQEAAALRFEEGLQGSRQTELESEPLTA